MTVDRPCVVLDGGPRHGWVYWEDEAKALRAVAEATGTPWLYQPTGETRRGVVQIKGRIDDGYPAHVWRYTP